MAKDLRKRLNLASPWEDKIQKWSAVAGVDSALVAAVLAQESGGDPGIGSGAGAKGLMQLMPIAVEDMGEDPVSFDYFDPDESLRVGTAYLAKMLKRFKGNEELALAAYNAGPTFVAKIGMVPDPAIHGAGYKETKNYVRDVGGMVGMLRAQSGPSPPFQSSPPLKKSQPTYATPTLGGEEFEEIMAEEKKENSDFGQFLGSLPVGQILTGLLARATGGSFDSAARNFTSGYVHADMMAAEKEKRARQQQAHDAAMQQHRQTLKDAKFNRAYKTFQMISELGDKGLMKNFLEENADTLELTGFSPTEQQLIAKVDPTTGYSGMSIAASVYAKTLTPHEYVWMKSQSMFQEDGFLEGLAKSADKMFEEGALATMPIGEEAAKIVFGAENYSPTPEQLAIVAQYPLGEATERAAAYAEAGDMDPETAYTRTLGMIDSGATLEEIPFAIRELALQHSSEIQAEATAESAELMNESILIGEDNPVAGKELMRRALARAEMTPYFDLQKLLDSAEIKTPPQFIEQAVAGARRTAKETGEAPTLEALATQIVDSMLGKEYAHPETGEMTTVENRDAVQDAVVAEIKKYEDELRDVGFETMEDRYPELNTTRAEQVGNLVTDYYGWYYGTWGKVITTPGEVIDFFTEPKFAGEPKTAKPKKPKKPDKPPEKYGTYGGMYMPESRMPR
jgi:hypothetical protein